MSDLPHNFKPGDWMCPNCNAHNFRSRSQCMKCSEPRPDDGGDAGYEDRRGDRRSGGFRDRDRGYGGRDDRRGGRDNYREERDDRGGRDRGSPGGDRLPPNFKPGDWLCVECNAHNFSRRYQCMRCGADRPDEGGDRGNDRGDRGGYDRGDRGGYDRRDRGGYDRRDGKPANFKPGDWMCPNCNAHNFRSRNSCMKCSEPRPDDDGGYDSGRGRGRDDRRGGGDYDGKPSNFKPGDWMCDRCNYHNFRSNAECKQCGNPAPSEGDTSRGSKRPLDGGYDDDDYDRRNKRVRVEGSDEEDERR